MEIQDVLEKNEKVLYSGKFHWTIDFAMYIVIIVLMALLAYFFLSNSRGNYTALVYGEAILAAILLGFLFFNTQGLKKSGFVLTEKRFIQYNFFMGNRQVELSLTKLESVVIEQGIIQKMIGTGHLMLVGSGGSKHVVKDVIDPVNAKKIISEQLASVNA